MIAGVRNTTKGFCGAADAPGYGTDEAGEIPETAFEVKMPAGGIIQFYRAGGGRWGNPLEREPEKVLDDVLNEFVSIESALDDYGVLIDPETLAVNDAETESVRASRLS